MFEKDLEHAIATFQKYKLDERYDSGVRLGMKHRREGATPDETLLSRTANVSTWLVCRGYLTALRGQTESFAQAVRVLFEQGEISTIGQ